VKLLHKLKLTCGQVETYMIKEQYERSFTN